MTGTTTGQSVSITNRNVTILADPGITQLSSPTLVGPMLQIGGTSSVDIFDLEISGGVGSDGFGILISGGAVVLSLDRVKLDGNGSGGLSATSATVNVLQSRILGNPGGGLLLTSSAFDIENNFIGSNGQSGSVSSVFGGVEIDRLAGTGSNILAFNTIADNHAFQAAGVLAQSVLPSITFSDNIIYGNDAPQVSGANVSYAHCDIGPDIFDGSGSSSDLNVPPSFVNEGSNDFHLTAMSLCRHAADPNADEEFDIDGDPRPGGSADDIGADQYVAGSN